MAGGAGAVFILSDSFVSSSQWSIQTATAIRFNQLSETPHRLTKLPNGGLLMSRPPTDAYWIERIKTLTANSRMGPLPISKQLKEEADELGRNDSPAERTVRRYQDDFRGSEEEGEYRFVRWPEV